MQSSTEANARAMGCQSPSSGKAADSNKHSRQEHAQQHKPSTVPAGLAKSVLLKRPRILLTFLQYVCRVDIADMAPKKRDRCIKEVHLLQQLHHPHIITMYDAFIDQNQLIIITEWAPGGEFSDLAHSCSSIHS